MTIQEAADQELMWSRAKIGKNRWVWVSWNDFGALCDGAAHDHGLSETEPYLDGKRCPANWALHWYREQVAKRKAQRPAKARDAQPVEYLHFSYFSDYDGSEHWVQVPIVQKTRKKVFVNRHSRVFALDRGKLESQGYVYHHRARESFYLEPRPEAVPDCLQILGLHAHATVEEVKTAYRRLVRKVHPDVGGISADFQRVHAAYEDALQLAERGDGRAAL